MAGSATESAKKTRDANSVSACALILHRRYCLHPLAACVAVALAAAPLRAGMACDAAAIGWHGLAEQITPPGHDLPCMRGLPALAAQRPDRLAHRAATLPVTSCLDDGSPGTLRAVVDSAVDGDTVDLTQLTCSTITLTGGPIDTNFLGPHPLNALTIQGPGRDVLTISAGGKSLVFGAGGYHGSSAVFTVNDLTVAHGVNTGTFWHEGAACIFSVRGTIVLNRVTVTDCHSTFLGGVSGGGAVGADGLLQITDSLISNSSVDAVGGLQAQGGGAWVGGRMVLVRSTVSGNRVSSPLAFDSYGLGAATGGGGVYSNGDLILIDSTISGNTAEATNPGENSRGGGAFARGTITVVGSTIEGNTTDGDAGGLYKRYYRCCFDPGTTLTIQNSTLTGNSAGGAGGGFVSERATTLANSTIAFNSSALGGAVMFRLADVPAGLGVGMLDLESSIIADNLVGDAAPYAADLATDDTLAVTGANNLVMAADAAIVLPDDTLDVDPLLLALADNGGLTRTLALQPGSPAIDAGANPADLATDQRGGGYVREYGFAADIGAFELQQTPDEIFANGFDP